MNRLNILRMCTKTEVEVVCLVPVMEEEEVVTVVTKTMKTTTMVAVANQ